MATEEKASASNEGVSWWSSWVQTAKEKSVSALSATTRDLAEFVTVVHRDTAQAVSGAANTIKVIVSGEEEEKKEAESGGKAETDGETDGALSYDRSVTQLNMLRSSTDTYCTIPDGHAAQFLEWSGGFDLPGCQDTISLLLVESPDVRRLHTELVPAKVSYEAFWHHYFYRVHLMEQEHAHRAAIMARAESQGKLIDWDEEEDEEEDGGNEARDRSGSSDSFICIGDETGLETKEDPVPSKEDTTALNENLSQQQQRQQEETMIHKKKKSKGGGGNDSDSDWERWSD